MMWLLPLGLVVLIIASQTRSARANSLGEQKMDPTYPPSAWAPVVASLISSKYPRVKMAPALKWIADESGGNPCAWGDPPPEGTAEDGNPREIGIGQLYNPDDFNRLKITSSSLRAYCVPGSQRLSRKLSPQEMIDQVTYTVMEPIMWGMEKVDTLAAQYTLPWGEVDYWKLVKAPHALPGIINTGFPAVVKKLGRTPGDWNEFRQVLGMDSDEVRQKALKRQPMTDEEKTRWRWMRALDACEKIGNSLTENGGVA